MIPVCDDINKMILLRLEPCELVSQFFKLNSCRVHFDRSRHLCLHAWCNLNDIWLNSGLVTIAHPDENAG